MTEMTKDRAVLKGQVAVVTGAARGIGAAIAEELAGLGAHVFLTARNETLLNSVKAKIEQANGVATVSICNLADETAILHLAGTVREQTGRCDVLINCAGIATCWHSPARTCAGRLGCNDGRKSESALPACPRLRAIDDRSEVRPHREHLVACRQESSAEWRGLLRLKVGLEWTYVFRC